MEFIKDQWIVQGIPYSEAKEWVLCKHYAHRIPVINYAFGLYERESGLQGVCTFGVPASDDLIIGSMGEEYRGRFLELNRLVVNDGLPRNALSFFVSQALKKLPRPLVVISYADTSMGHHGYIYQATNWIYTGLSQSHIKYIVEGQENKHCRHLLDGINREKGESVFDLLSKKYGEGKVTKAERSRKHRYFKFLGDKRQVRRMEKDLKYKVIKQYPKGENKRYDASYQTHSMGLLFIQ